MNSKPIITRKTVGKIMSVYYTFRVDRVESTFSENIGCSQEPVTKDGREG